MSECTSKYCELSRQGPNHPTCSKVLAGTRRYQGSGKSRQARLVQTAWFHRSPWLSLCESRQKLEVVLFLLSYCK